MTHLHSRFLLLCLLTWLQPLLGLHNLCAETKTRPTVAVVLSGGGARGVSHIPVLRAIEKAGIPIDIVVGTSMGALVGGLYAQGYSPDELDSITRSANWAEVMSDLDIQSRGDIRYRHFTSPFVLNIPFDRRLSEMLEGGIIKGRNVEGLINRLTLYPDSMSFDSLPIRYACVATDLASGKEIVFHNGKIAYAMRTSMAVPGIFAAVRQDSMVLVDGGLTNNFPVDVARSMGADVIIGVDLFSALKNSSELRTALDMVSQMLSMCIGDKEEENVADCDLYINTNTKGYSSTDFTTEKIDSLLLKGTQSAEKAWPRLTALRDSLFSDSATMANYVRPHSLCKELKAAMKEADENTEVSKLAPAQSLLSIGARLDTDEWAAVILGLTGRVREGKTRFPLWGEFVFRAGMRLHGMVKLNAGIARHAMVSFSYRTDRNNISLRRGQFNLITGTHVRGLAELNLTSCYRRTLLTAGVNFEHLHYRDVMFIGGLDGADVEAEKIIRYFLRFNFDNTNQRSTPTSGQRWIVEGQLASSNGIKYNGKPIVPILYGDWQMYISTPINLVVSPYVRGRLIFREVLDYAVSTTLVNTHRGGYSLGHSLAMAGIQKLEDVDRGVAIGGVELRQDIGKSFYAGLAANIAFNGDKPSHIFDETIWGVHALCGYKTVLGPIEAVVNWNTRERKKVGFLLSIGHKF